MSTPPTPTHPLFVYGTLMRGEPAYPLVAAYVLAVAPARLAGVNLYSLGAYPLAVAGRGHITGELFWLRPDQYDEALRHLDAYEGPQYTREICQAQDLTHNIAVAAWAYLGQQPPQSPHPQITDGDWRAYCHRTEP